MEPKQTAFEYLDYAKDFIVMTDECVIVNAEYPVIEKMLNDACKQPQLKAMIVKTAQRIMHNDMLAMLN